MIGHQAVRPDRDTMLAALLTQQIAIEFVVGVGEKHVLAPISALGDMMGQTGNDETGDAGHGRLARTRREQWNRLGV